MKNELSESLIPPSKDKEMPMKLLFDIPIEKINSIFDPSNLSKKESMKILMELGGMNQIYKSLQTDPNNGISISLEDEKLQRQKTYGINVIEEKPLKGLFEIICDQLGDTLLRLLLLAATVSMIIGIWEDGIELGWIDGISIYIAVILIVSISSGNNYVKAKQFRILQQTREKRNVSVIRNHSPQLIDVSELMVGDILILNQGEMMPVDAILISGSQISADESSQTGESIPIAKFPYNEKELNYDQF